jgi:hypothetical protein
MLNAMGGNSCQCTVGCTAEELAANGGGFRKVYSDLLGPAAGTKNYLYMRVFMDTNDPAYSDCHDGSVLINPCQVIFTGPYTSDPTSDIPPPDNPDPSLCMPTCSIADVQVNSDGVCDGVDVTFSLHFDVTDGSGFYEIIATADNPDYGISTGDVLGSTLASDSETDLVVTGTVVGPTSPAGVISVTVRDQFFDATCEGLPVNINIPECPICVPDAGDIANNSSSPGTLEVCAGSDLLDTDGTEVIFSVDYSSADEFNPGEGIDYAFILTDGTGDILQYNFDGNFDFSGLALGTYNIYGLSYVGELNTPDNVADYLASLSPNNFSTIVLDDNDVSSGGLGNGAFCLDIGNDGLSGHSTSVERCMAYRP